MQLLRTDDAYRCERIETTLRTINIRLLWAGALIRMSGGRLPKRIVFGNLEGAVQRGRGGKEKAEDWKATALDQRLRCMWVETVTEGGRRFMLRGGKKR